MKIIKSTTSHADTEALHCSACTIENEIAINDADQLMVAAAAMSTALNATDTWTAYGCLLTSRSVGALVPCCRHEIFLYPELISVVLRLCARHCCRSTALCHV